VTDGFAFGISATNDSTQRHIQCFGRRDRLTRLSCILKAQHGHSANGESVATKTRNRNDGKMVANENYTIILFIVPIGYPFRLRATMTRKFRSARPTSVAVIYILCLLRATGRRGKRHCARRMTR